MCTRWRRLCGSVAGWGMGFFGWTVAFDLIELKRMLGYVLVKNAQCHLVWMVVEKGLDSFTESSTTTQTPQFL